MEILELMKRHKERYSSEKISTDIEGKEWLSFVLYLYLSGKFPLQSQERIYLFQLRPIGWTLKDVCNKILFSFHLYGFDSFVDFRMDTEQNSLGYEKMILTEDTFVGLKEDDLKMVYIYLRESLPHEVLDSLNNEMREAFSYEYTNVGRFIESGKNLEAIFEKLFELNGDEFELSQANMWKYTDKEFIETVRLFVFIDFIEITGIGFESKKVEGIEKDFYIFGIRITEKFRQIIETNIDQKSILLESVFSSKYKSLSVQKQKGKPHIIERSLEIDADSTKFVDLQKQYPYGEISAINHGGKIKKYEIKEKIRLDK